MFFAKKKTVFLSRCHFETNLNIGVHGDGQFKSALNVATSYVKYDDDWCDSVMLGSTAQFRQTNGVVDVYI